MANNLIRQYAKRGATGTQTTGTREQVTISNEEGAVPDFLRMDQPISSDPANAKKTGKWHGWPTKDIDPVTLTDDEGRTVRIRTPIMDLEGLITPTHLHYTVQHFAVPPVVESAEWS